MDFDFDPLEFSIFETTFRFPTKNVNNNWTVDREEVDTQNRLWSNDPGSPARPGLPDDKKTLKYNLYYKGNGGEDGILACTNSASVRLPSPFRSIFLWETISSNVQGQFKFRLFTFTFYMSGQLML